ncbi:MAG: DNA repair protein RecN, partial [Lachnospiraceae bacterium]|nr:DNA repair protein RecN [Candidatus Equihabitans merdae]
DPQVFKETEDRLNTINRLKAKYGRTIEAVLDALSDKQNEFEELAAFEERQAQAEQAFEAAKTELEEATLVLTAKRKECARSFESEAAAHFMDLNFARADFRLDFSVKNDYTANGRDDVEYMIATNPGEPILPLKTVASGGELSRIMLGIRTMFADRDHVETLIFDEIDTGISGRTAQKVAEKLQLVSEKHQTFCITHLPQIAAMGDNHYRIMKEISADIAETKIEALSQEEAVEELARLLGGAEINDITYQAASNMNQLAMQKKKG